MKNTLVSETTDPYYNRHKGWMVDFVKPGANKVLDLGCANGVFGKVLMEQGRATIVDGVEIYEPSAAEAAKCYRTVHVGDIEMMNLNYSSEFEYIICGDILEHLRDPYTMIKRIRNWLKPGGSLLVCLPNVRNYHVVRDLIFRGEWRYVPQGIMDNTHLRFFTRRSTCRMLAEGNLPVYHSQMLVEGPRKQFFNRITLGVFSEFLAAQTFVCGRKGNP